MLYNRENSAEYIKALISQNKKKDAQELYITKKRLLKT